MLRQYTAPSPFSCLQLAVRLVAAIWFGRSSRTTNPCGWAFWGRSSWCCMEWLLRFNPQASGAPMPLMEASMENKAVIVYKVYALQAGSKGYTPQPILYFGRELTGYTMELNALNLKRAFPTALELHHLLDMLPDANIITTYDGDRKMYGINSILLNFSFDFQYRLSK